MARIPVRGYLFVAACCAIGVTGCSDDPLPNKDNNKAASEEPAEAGVGGQEQTAEGFAEEFLAAAANGAADPADLTDSFKRLIAPPLIDADTARGFDERAAGSWLNTVARGQFTITRADGPAFRAGLTGPGGDRTFALLLEPSGPNGYQVAWFWPTASDGGGRPPEGVDVAAATYAAGFLDVLHAGGMPNLTLAERMMAVPVRIDIGGSPTAADTAEGLPYNRSWLHAQLRKYAADSYRITGGSKGEDGSFTFTVELVWDSAELTLRRQDGGWEITGLKK